eukprot:Plantae.Rhodophyta-Palmaria_palmata.ctg5839.p1 GENE.Plantae.Rhodophyta-Palmaria_palmata.ctg5839~~Plantae.Rhodophyta-Palmaria_palmata.ctg5839.p1  ORF type:complete len:179 (-),score=12.42 Plantae.Rhodophyta-Palmaria_palmata.ctg5839:96-632(-)
MTTQSQEESKDPYKDPTNPFDEDSFYDKKQDEVEKGHTSSVASKSAQQNTVPGSPGTTPIEWTKQDWANKTPKEIAEMAEAEAEDMMHDRYVPFVAIAVATVAMAFTLFVAQQMVENPHGIVPKLCKCSVAIVRIVCWPVRCLLCGCCFCRSSSSSSSSTHEPLSQNSECVEMQGEMS